MKNLRKILSAILSTALCLSLVLPASASTAGTCASNSLPATAVGESVQDKTDVAPQDGPVNGGTCLPVTNDQSVPTEDPKPVQNATTSSGSTLCAPPEAPPMPQHQVTPEMLLALRDCLFDTFWLQEYVDGLKDYNTFDPTDGLFTLRHEYNGYKCVVDYLASNDRKLIAQISTHQAFMILRSLDIYHDNDEFRSLVDEKSVSFYAYAPNYVRIGLAGFVPRETSELLNPDQLVIVGNMIVMTDKYQQLRNAIAPIGPYTKVSELQEIFSDSEITSLYDKIVNAAMLIWPNGCANLGLAKATDANGYPTLVPLPTGATGN